jgi:uncharacterized membrane protein
MFLFGIKKSARQIRTNIIAGVLLLIPSVTTIYVFVKLFNLVDSLLPSLFHSILPFMPEKWGVPGIGLIVILIVSYFVGIAAKNYFGRIIIDTGNAILAKIPFINKIYLGVQQIIDSISGQKKALFERVVLARFPQGDSYCIGFVTSESTGEIAEKLEKDVISVFVPTTPNPTSGFLLYLPRSEVKELEMSVETAVKLVMSGGMVNPDQIKQTNHMYALPKQLKNFNWLSMFKRDAAQIPPDPRD